MKTFRNSSQKREKLGKSETRRLRNQSMVPCVMYGGEENLHFYAHENLFNKVVFSPDVFLVQLNVDGQKLHGHHAGNPVSSGDRQDHPYRFRRSDRRANPLWPTFPINLTGNSIGIRNGGKLRQRKRYLKVKGLAENLPDRLDVDITNVNIGDVIKVERPELSQS